MAGGAGARNERNGFAVVFSCGGEERNERADGSGATAGGFLRAPEHGIGVGGAEGSTSERASALVLP